MNQKLYIPVLYGTVREGRRSISAAKLVEEIGRGFDNVETELIDPRDFNFQGEGEGPDNKNPRFSEITARADGFFIVTPEYNHSFPGTLKRMLDSEFANYSHKPVAFGGVSDGPWGGVRAIQALLATARRTGMYAMQTDVQFPMVKELFDENGKLQDEAQRERVEKIWQDLIKAAEVLKHGRDTIWKQ